MMFALRGDEIGLLWRLQEKLAHVLLDQLIGLRLAGGAVLELEQRVDEGGLDEPAGVVGVAKMFQA